MAARKGDKRSIAKLAEIPDFPETVGYLYDWTLELHGHCGTTADGMFAPIGWVDLDAWARRQGIEPTDDEQRAIMRIDLAMRHPDLFLDD